MAALTGAMGRSAAGAHLQRGCQSERGEAGAHAASEEAERARALSAG